MMRSRAVAGRGARAAGRGDVAGLGDGRAHDGDFDAFRSQSGELVGLDAAGDADARDLRESRLERAHLAHRVGGGARID